MTWFLNRKKCKLCKTKYPKKTNFHELRYETLDGVQILEICPKCAHVLDKSADVLLSLHEKGQK